ncbi:MAG TPA: phosphoheptose isomerase, partial [Bryobacteraceae bacterium]|nr:phosphoheptose isomerase [Bryobacteraceae bacterium]
MTGVSPASESIASKLLRRNEIYRDFFEREADRLALACQAMAERFLRGGRLLAFGRGVYSTDAQHVSVEFIHPVIVGKRALPAMDLSALFGPQLEALVTAEDIAMGFGPPGGDPQITDALSSARHRGAMT